MNAQSGSAALLQVVKSLRRAGSWTGKTHIQKCVFLLKELCGVDLGYAYTLYKHGPYSFDLDAEIERLRIIGTLDYEIAPQYGPRYKIGAASATNGFVDAKVAAAADEVAEFLGEKNVQDLECISTLVWCARNRPDASASQEVLTSCVKELKPHLSDTDVFRGLLALRAYKDALKLRYEAAA